MLVGIVMCGCASDPQPVGRATDRSELGARDVLAKYSGSTLKARLEPVYSVLTVRAAAEQALRSRGYTITESSASSDRARVVGRAAGSGPGLVTIVGTVGVEQVVVEAAAISNATELRVRFEPWGDEAQSRTVMDAVLTRLGR
ncbi:MAG: hypothetical protein ACK4WH_09515 [Phycisphaerales bacterium]